MISGSHHRISSHHHQGVGFTRQAPESPASTYGSDDSEPNDLSTSKSHPSHHPGSASYPYYSPPHHGSSQQSPYTATNDCRIIEYRGHRIAAFLSVATTKHPAEYLLCLPQAFELFLKHLVGGLHTVYTKLKRLDIVPIVCNVEQVRILRGLGAIQPGVNRCKLLSTKDFDVLYKDCTTASRPGRPPKRSPVSGMVSPIPTPISVPTDRATVVPAFLGFAPSSKKPRYGDDPDYGSESPDLKHHHSSHHHQDRREGGGGNGAGNSAATAAAMLAANGYSAAFPFLQHFAASQSNNNSSSAQQQQLAAAAAALGLPGLPGNRFGNNSSPPPHSHQSNLGGGNNHGSLKDRERESREGSGGHESSSGPGEFNPTAAYLWLLSQQQHHPAAAAAVLNLSSGSAIGGVGGERGRESRDMRDRASHSSPGARDSSTRDVVANAPTNSSSTHNNTGIGSINNNPATQCGSEKNSSGTNNLSSNNNHTSNNLNHKRSEAVVDDSTDDEEEDDDAESRNSSRSDNPVSSTGFNGLATIGNGGGHATGSTGSPAPDGPTGRVGGESRGHHVAGQESGDQQHSLETLLRNIEGLLAIAAHNARQQQSQLHQQKAELRADLAAAVEREREMREQVERQLNEEHKVRMVYQRRFKKERRLRRTLEQELNMIQRPNSKHHHQQQHQQQKEILLTNGSEESRERPEGEISSSPKTVEKRCGSESPTLAGASLSPKQGEERGGASESMPSSLHKEENELEGN